MRARDRGAVSAERDEWITGWVRGTRQPSRLPIRTVPGRTPVTSTDPKIFGCRLVPKSPNSKIFGLGQNFWQSKRGLTLVSSKESSRCHAAPQDDTEFLSLLANVLAVVLVSLSSELVRPQLTNKRPIRFHFLQTIQTYSLIYFSRSPHSDRK